MTGWIVDFESAVTADELGALLFCKMMRQCNDPSAGLDSRTEGSGKEGRPRGAMFNARPSRSRSVSTSSMAKARSEHKEIEA